MAKTETLFKRCPLCGAGRIYILRRKIFLLPRTEIQSCPVCSAKFAARGEERYQLVYCEPFKVVEGASDGRYNCRERVYRGCYLGATFHRSEWEKIADGGEAEVLERFLQMSKKFMQGSLPSYPSNAVPFPLEAGEVVHYISSPVYLGEAQPSCGKSTDRGDLILTNMRIIYARGSKTRSIAIEDVERVEETTPGFFIKEKDSYEPLYLIPLPHDPVPAAVKGLVNSSREKR